MSDTIECTATRRGRTWVVSIPAYGVYGHGRTLKKAHENVTQGLALVGVCANVAITPVTPELEKLRAAEAAYTAALSEAISALTLRRTSLRDIAAATRLPASRVKRHVAEETQETLLPNESGRGAPTPPSRSKELRE
ncbi:hypothetical protein ACN2WE_31060 [Streptomyces sp. cg28]|uniref:hypothetical protein n=1 Tax=Streptomyces sp. cg28 TaxID=3403457 RepID=UPI003B20D197